MNSKEKESSKEKKSHKQKYINLNWEMDGLSFFTNNKLTFSQKEKEILWYLMGKNCVPLSYYKEVSLITLYS